MVAWEHNRGVVEDGVDIVLKVSTYATIWFLFSLFKLF